MKLGFWLCLSIAILSIPIERHFNDRQEDFKKSQEAFSSAMVMTESDLAGIIHDLREDKSLSMNVSWKMWHSVEQTLGGYLQAGRWEWVALLSPECDFLAQASLFSTPSSFRCDSEPGTNIHKPFMTLDSNDSTLGENVFFIREQLTDGIQVVVGLRLGNEWRNLWPFLNAKWDVFDFSISSQPPFKHSVSLGLDFSNMQLWSNSKLSLALLKLDADSQVYYGFLLLAILLGAVSYFRLHQDRGNYVRIWKDFSQWCGLRNSGNYPSKERLHELRMIIAQKQKSNDENTVDLEKQVLELKNHLKEREEVQQSLSLEIENLKYYKHWAYHQRDIVESVRNIVSKGNEDFEDLLSVANNGIVPYSRQLSDLWNRWKTGINQLGERKFIRTLAETPYPLEQNIRIQKDLDGRNQLNEDINQALFLGQSLENQIIANGQILSKLKSEWTQFFHVVNIWWNLIEGNDLRPGATAKDSSGLLSFAQPLKVVSQMEGQLEALLKLNKKYRKVRLLINVEAIHFMASGIAADRWVQIIYQSLCVLLHDYDTESDRTLSISGHQENQNSIILIACVGSKVRSQGSNRREVSTESAAFRSLKNLISQSQVECLVLPQKNEGSNIALTWKSQEKSQQKRTPKAKKESALEASLHV